MTQSSAEHARQIAVQAHRGQLDKIGNPYITHCERVAELVVGDDERAVAFLHDVVEKGKGWTPEKLREEGFTTSIVQAVEALTRRADEKEDAFLIRSMSDHLARPVKRADLEDNLVQAEQAGLDTAKFVHGLRVLEDLR
jgi:(p)ppGpp synthase/HD superfamily hydrolase